ncbi:MAG: hypothetical protein LAO21_02560 [Acidobacteriia bacterium]|nr:hypothetical protein [Terriglobia bacterium]
MHIQYVDYVLSDSTRRYTFDVIDAVGKSREFSVILPLEAFRRSDLKAQDGPGICYDRMVEELGRETEETRAVTPLQIKDQDILEYLKKHYPRKHSGKREVGTSS